MLKRLEPEIYALMRMVIGLMFIMHGTQKLFAWPNGKVASFPSLRFLAGILELAGGSLLVLGLFTSVTAFVCSGLMAVAYFMAHAPQAFLPIVNRGELAVAYCFLFLFMAAYGPGAWSLDGSLRKLPKGRAQQR